VLLKDEEPRLPEEAREAEVLWMEEKRPRVAIDRASSSSQIYFTGRTLYPPGCGLWFGVRWAAPDPNGEALLAELLNDLGDAGLGGERSAGFGRARFAQVGALALPDPAGGMGVTLSRWLPREDETGALRHAGAAYNLVSVGGWIGSPGAAAERRRPVHFLTEGSLIGPLPRPVPGQIVDVRPVYGGQAAIEHPVWRSGLGVLAGLTLN
jgi:CRISPR-associated protein Csm4